jgi:carboxyl-terminal processing protease
MKLLSLTITLLLLTATAYGKTEPLVFTKEHSQTAMEIIDTLGSKHYKKQVIDDDFSSHLLDSYFDALDPVKVYFLKSDITQFEANRYTFDDDLEDGDLTQGFDIFNLFRERISDRLESNIRLLESDFSFDFSLEEAINHDRDARTWMTSQEEADDYWRRRMKDSLLRLVLSGKEPEAARELLRKRYANQLKQLARQDADDAVQGFVNVLAGIYDPHTSYLAPRTLENFNISMSLSLEGIGAVLQLEDEFTKIVRIVPGGPADKQGTLAAEDKIIGVAQDDAAMVDIIGWRLDDVVELIRGKKNSRVRLEVIPGTSKVGDKTKIVTITRDKVKLEEQAAKSKVIELQQGDKKFRAGVITVPAFYMDFEAYRQRDPNFKSTSRDVMKLIADLKEQDVDGIILRC